MTVEVAPAAKPRIDRSPAYPYVSLEKALSRAKAMDEKHKREAARLIAVGVTWGYSPKSSGLAQTVGALIQFGLVDDMGSGNDRKIQVTDLARRILFDTRPGIREQGLKEAALKPRLIAECFTKWGVSRPSDEHCVSELTFDRGFNDAGARLFLKNYDETITFAGLSQSDSSVPVLEDEISEIITKAPAHPGGGEAALKEAVMRRIVIAPVKRSTLALPEGLVAVEIPDRLSRASHNKLAKWLELIVEFADVEPSEAQ